MGKFIKVFFLNSNLRIEGKEYSYKIKDSVYETIKNTFYYYNNRIPTYSIKNVKGYDYRNSQVVISGIYSEELYHHLDFESMVCLSSIREGKNHSIEVPKHLFAKFDNVRYALFGKEEENINKKGESKMFENVFKDLKFGKLESNVVKMSAYGLSVKTRDNVYLAYDKNKEDYVDVTGLTFDGLNLFYVMPVAKKDVKVGDYIFHNDTPIRVSKVSDDGTITADNIFLKEKVKVMPTKNLFGFDFYTKIMDFGANLFGEVDSDNPFGNMLPFLMMKDGLGSGTSDMLPLLMMSGGFGKEGLDFQKNPMLPFILFGDKDKSNDLLPLLFLSGGFGK